MITKTFNLFFFLAVLFVGSACSQQNTPFETGNADVEIVYEDGFNFYVANDLGRNGSYRQKPVAEVMGGLADSLNIEFIAAAGDVHHYGGVQSTSDPIWMTNFELIYSHGDLMIDWYPILGNHEYRGNTQAVIDYSEISRRWVMPARYYAKSFAPEDNDEFASLKVVFIDTTPLIDNYHGEPEKYPDVAQQDTIRQLRWLEEELANATEDFKIVIGHHPIYVSEKKRVDEESLVEKLDPILRKHNVHLYVAGHSHTFQHLTKAGTDVNYIVNGSASRGREPMEGPDTQFCSADEGFSVISVGSDSLKMTFINYEGVPIYTFNVVK